MTVLRMKQNPYATDVALVEGLRQNEGKAFEALYRMSFGQTKKWIMQNNGSEQDAEDVFQDAVMAVWKNIKEGKYEKKQQVKLNTYVFQICKFRWYEHLKSARMKYNTKLNAEMDVVDNDDMDLLSKQSEQVQYLSRLFNQLGEKCQLILKYYYYQKLSLREIAGQMGYTSQTAKNEKYRCMQRLKKLHQP